MAELTTNEQLDNGEFVARARADIPALLDALNAAEAEIERLKAVIKDERADHKDDMRTAGRPAWYEEPSDG